MLENPASGGRGEDAIRAPNLAKPCALRAQVIRPEAAASTWRAGGASKEAAKSGRGVVSAEQKGGMAVKRLNELGKEMTVPDDADLRKKIRDFAKRQVQKLGIRKRLGEYPHPQKFAKYKSYYQYCLATEVKRLLERGGQTMTTKELVTLGRCYVLARTNRERHLILRKAYSQGGFVAVEALARHLQMDVQASVEAVKSLFAAEKAKRRGRKEVVYVLPAPKPYNMLTDEARDIALEAAGAARMDDSGPGGGKRKNSGSRTDVIASLLSLEKSRPSA
ncbi:MAG: hypothetical protein PWR11_645 [Bacillota bacterium]|nr:hypothetical protein [Bacillota bacterium]